MNIDITTIIYLLIRLIPMIMLFYFIFQLMIYFDYNATAPLHKNVIKKIQSLKGYHFPRFFISVSFL